MKAKAIENTFLTHIITIIPLLDGCQLSPDSDRLGSMATMANLRYPEIRKVLPVFPNWLLF